MKIMVDTNIIIDVLLEREPFVNDSYKLLSLCEEHQIDGFVSASSITDIYYLVRKYTHSNELAYKAIGKILEIVKICSVMETEKRSISKAGDSTYLYTPHFERSTSLKVSRSIDIDLIFSIVFTSEKGGSRRHRPHGLHIFFRTLTILDILSQHINKNHSVSDYCAY